jgi:hypothetical protein
LVGFRHGNAYSHLLVLQRPITGRSMVLTMAPTVAFAADTTSDPAAQSNPVAQIKGAQKSSVYFGNYKQSSDGNGDYLTEPIKWRVLQSADGKLFLLADKILDVYYYHHNGSTSRGARKVPTQSVPIRVAQDRHHVRPGLLPPHP